MEDPFVRRAVVLGLIVIVLVGLVASCVLSYQNKSVPDSIIGTTAGALGGLTGILVRMPSGSSDDPAE